MSRRELVISYALNSRIRPRLRDYTTTCLVPLVLSLVSSTCTGTGISTGRCLLLPYSFYSFQPSYFQSSNLLNACFLTVLQLFFVAFFPCLVVFSDFLMVSLDFFVISRSSMGLNVALGGGP